MRQSSKVHTVISPLYPVSAGAFLNSAASLADLRRSAEEIAIHRREQANKQSFKTIRAYDTLEEYWKNPQARGQYTTHAAHQGPEVHGVGLLLSGLRPQGRLRDFRVRGWAADRQARAHAHIWVRHRFVGQLFLSDLIPSLG